MKPITATDLSPGALYTVAIRKFLMLYLLTGGGYLFYWSYRNWATYKKTTGAAITPVVRGLFWPFFILELFDNIQRSLDIRGRGYFWYCEARGLLIMLVVMICILLSLFFDRPSDTVFVLVVDAVLMAGSLFLFIGAQRAINILADDPQGLGNHGFSSGDVLWTLLGGMCMALVVYIVFAVRA